MNPRDDEKKATVYGIAEKLYTNEDLIQQILMLTNELGRIPTTTEFAEDPRTASSMTVIRRFGSWRQFLIAAKLKTNDWRHTDDELIAQVQTLATELGRTPNRREFNLDSRTANSETVVRRFGSWNNFLQIAGLKTIRRCSYTDEELIGQVLMLAEKYGRTPRQSEFEKDPETASTKTVKRKFGTWNQLLMAAGLEVNVRRDYTDQELIAQVQSLAKELGGTPTSVEFRSDPNTANDMTAIRRFGSWNKFLKAAGLKPNMEYKSKK